MTHCRKASERKADLLRNADSKDERNRVKSLNEQRTNSARANYAPADLEAMVSEGSLTASEWERCKDKNDTDGRASWVRIPMRSRIINLKE